MWNIDSKITFFLGNSGKSQLEINCATRDFNGADC